MLIYQRILETVKLWESKPNTITTQIFQNNYVSFYSEISTIYSTYTIINNILSSKSSIFENQKEHEKLSKMFENEDFSEYPETKLKRRLMTLTAAISQKNVAIQHCTYLLYRLIQMEYDYIDYEIDYMEY
jgi:hypothetical protein